MLAVIWSGGQTASDILFLIAAIVAGVYAIVVALQVFQSRNWKEPIEALSPLALGLVAVGLLAL